MQFVVLNKNGRQNLLYIAYTEPNPGRNAPGHNASRVELVNAINPT